MFGLESKTINDNNAHTENRPLRHKDQMSKRKGRIKS